MTVALVANIARPISSAISTAFSADSYGSLSSYGLLGASANPDAVIEALFANNEQGAWYDPSDLSTMFQDSAGSIPSEIGQPFGLILDKSKGLGPVQYPPIGFGTVPFGATIFPDGTTDFVATSPINEGDAGVVTCYVDIATGLDTNVGTVSSPMKTIRGALLKYDFGPAPKLLLKVKAGVYGIFDHFGETNPSNTTLSCVTWGAGQVICTNEYTVSWTLESGSTWYCSSAGQAYADYSSSVWDGQYPDTWGEYGYMKKVNDLATCNSTANSYFVDQPTARVYVHTTDGRQPDVNTHVFNAWNSPGQYKSYGSIMQNLECYFEGFTFLGGASAFGLQQANDGLFTKAQFKDCTFKYTTGATINQLGYLEVAFDSCLVSSSYNDGISYQAYGASLPPSGLEINCESRMCGLPMTSTSNQASTMHDGGKIVRVNGNYHSTENDQVADVGLGTMVWMVKCNTSDGLKPNYSGIFSGNGTTSWIYDCTVSGCTYTLHAESGSTLYDKNRSTRTDVNGIVINYAAVGLSGNHASQGTAAARPLHKETGLAKWTDYDAVDDVLNTTFQSALGSSCTVARANVGAAPTILTAQTIGTSYADSTDNAGLIIVNRALTTQETIDLTAWLTAKGATA